MILGFTVRSRTFDASADSEELALVKDFLRVSHSFDDLTVIPASIEAALEYCEACGNVAYVDCEIEATFSSIGSDGVELPLTALRAITSVERFTDGAFVTLSDSAYSVGTLATETTPARLYIEDGIDPDSGEGPRYRVVYRAGLSATLGELSNRLKMGILLAVNHFYAHRNEQNPDKTIPRSVSDLVTINRSPVL
jgi:uncharacterized phiE125 gp8 family phage protein